MKVAVFGHHGMLGKEVVKQLRAAGDIVVTPMHRIESIDPPAYVWKHEVECVVNCAGRLPGSNYVGMIQANAVGPWVLATQFHGKIVHVSTDCVFSGSIRRAGYHATTDLPDPIDVYGRSKLLGEVEADNVVNVRTSFIGFDHGFLKWLIDTPVVNGWRNAMWSGSTVYEVARCLIKYYVHKEGIDSGISHLAAPDPISKYDLIHLVGRALGLEGSVTGVNEPHINRSLMPTYPLKFDSNILEELKGEFNSRYQNRVLQLKA